MNFTLHSGADDFWRLTLLSLTWRDYQVHRVTGTQVQGTALVLSSMCLLNSIWNEIFSPYSSTGSSCSLCSWVEGCFASHCYHCSLEDGGPWRMEKSTAFGWAADGRNLSWIKFPLGARHLVIPFTWGHWILTNTHGVIIIMSYL